MSEIFDRYVGHQVKIVSGAGVSGFSTDGALRETEGQWLVVDNVERGRIFVRRDLIFFIESDAPVNPNATLPRSARGDD